MKPPANGLIDGFNDGLTSGMDRPCTKKKRAHTFQHLYLSLVCYPQKKLQV
jgi:hypothetical protein